jgi:hypothetical protein
MGESLNEIKELKELLIKIFKMSNLGDSKMYLRIDIDYNCKNWTFSDRLLVRRSFSE